MSTINRKAARRLGVRRFDAAEYLKDEADIAAYVTAALAENDPPTLAGALGAVARARGMTQLAAATGITREALYRALSVDGNPSLDTLLRVIGGLGLRLDVRPVGHAQGARRAAAAARMAPPARRAKVTSRRTAAALT